MSPPVSPLVEPAAARVRWAGLAVVLTGSLLGSLDFFIVNIALPSIGESLGASSADLDLVVAFYGLAYGAALITGGRLGDLYGRKRVFLLGMVGFAVTSMLCGLAPTPAFLIGSRALQGLCAAAMFPQTLSTIRQVTFTGRERSLAFAIYGVVVGIGAISGNLLAGLLIEANWWGSAWRPIFLINVPIAALCLACAGALRETRAVRAQGLDLGGIGLVSVALIAVVYPIAVGREHGWSPWCFALFVLGLLLGQAFLHLQRRKAAAGRPVLIDMRLFAIPGLRWALATASLFFAGLGALLFTLTLYLQEGLHFPPSRAGFAAMPHAAAYLVGSFASGQFVDKHGHKLVMRGGAVMSLALLSLAALVSLRSPNLTLPELAVVLFMYGLGQGFAQPTLANLVMRHAPERDAGSVAGLMATLQQVASSLGVALLGTTFFSIAALEGPAPHVDLAFIWTLGLIALLLGGSAFCSHKLAAPDET